MLRAPRSHLQAARAARHAARSGAQARMDAQARVQREAPRHRLVPVLSQLLRRYRARPGAGSVHTRPMNTENTSPPRGLNIVLVGLMGSGKTTVGRLAAQSLGFGFLDTDQLIAESAG